MASQGVDPRGLGDDELHCLLRELDEVIEDFDNGSSCQYEEHLEELKQKSGLGLGIYDSGIDEAESTNPSPGSSLNTSEENIHLPVVSSAPKAKLGDTKSLEDYIADLDKELEGILEAKQSKGLRPVTKRSEPKEKPCLPALC